MKIFRGFSFALFAVILLFLLSLTAFAEPVTIPLDENGIPTSASGTGWEYNSAESNLIVNSGEVTFGGKTLTCSHLLINEDVSVSGVTFSGNLQNFGTISGGNFSGCANYPSGTISGGNFSGGITSGGTISGGNFSGGIT